MYVVQNYWPLFWTLSIVFYEEVKRPQGFADCTVTVPRWMGHDIPTHLGPLERTCLNYWQTPARKKQLINTQQRV
jgi:hypothetical protein